MLVAMNLLISIIFIGLIGFLLFLLYRNQTILSQFPKPPRNFLFGHVLELASTTRVLSVVLKYIQTYGSTIQIRIGPFKYGLVTTDYKFVEFLLTSNKILKKSENYLFLRAWLGAGLLLNDGEEWRRHRKIITPAFHFEILKQFVDVFESVGDIFISKLHQRVGEKSVDLHPIVTLCTLDIICETAMGAQINAQSHADLPYVKCVQEMCRIITDRALSPFGVYELTYRLKKDYYLQKRILKTLHTATTNVIHKRRGIVDSSKDDGGAIGETQKRKIALLDLLLKLSSDGNSLDNDVIRNQVDTFMFAGHDTTASAITFTLYCLANHPDVQAKAFEEQRILFGEDKNPKITYADLQNMPYLELVIKESLRLYPSVPFIGRYTQEPFEYEGHTIPSNTNIAIFIFGIHRNPEFFPDPEAFIPERFETLDKSAPYAFIPFSAGPRNCIGFRFALLEIKSLVSKVLRSFELVAAYPKHDLILAAETVLKSINGVRVGLRRRRYNEKH